MAGEKILWLIFVTIPLNHITIYCHRRHHPQAPKKLINHVCGNALTAGNGSLIWIIPLTRKIIFKQEANSNMRQVNINIAKTRLNYELKNLPFEIVKGGKVVAVVEKAKKITPRKYKGKATAHTDGSRWVNPLKNTVLAPKE